MCVMWEGSWYSLFYGENYSKTLVGTLFGFQQVSTGWLGVGVIIIHKIYCLYSIKTILKSPHVNRCTNVCMCVCVCVCEYPSSIHNLAEYISLQNEPRLEFVDLSRTQMIGQISSNYIHEGLS